MEKSEGKILEEKLCDRKKIGWESLNEDDKKVVFKFSDEYIWFLNKSKTEREFAENAKAVLDKNGFKDIADVQSVKPGDKVYFCNSLFLYYSPLYEYIILHFLRVVKSRC